MRAPLASTLPVILCAVASTTSPQPQNIFSNPSDPASSSSLRIPSVHESAIQARRILHLSNIATLSTTFPPSSSSPSEDSTVLENRPHDVAHAPIGLMEYYASCAPHAYNPTILGVTIATTMKNAASGSNVTLSLRYHLPADAPPTDDPWAYLPANLPRFALVGYLEKLSAEEVREHNIRECFLAAHPEASIWEPGSDIHDSWWGRLVVQEVYFFGGFGDRARIGWIPIQEWRRVTQEEVERYRLVGEGGYEIRLQVDDLGWENADVRKEERVFKIQVPEL